MIVKSVMRIFIVGLAAICFSTFSAVSDGMAKEASFIVLQAKNAPASLAEGMLIPGKGEIEVPAGAEITLMGEDGTTLKLVGHTVHSFQSAPTEKTGSGALKRLSGWIKGKRKQTTKLGAFRKPGGKNGVRQIPPGPWLVDSQASGKWCVRSTGQKFWKPGTPEAMPVSIEPRGKPAIETTWPGSEETLDIPPGILTDGQRLKLRVGQKSVRLTLFIAPQSLEDRASTLAWLAEKGCRKQALALIEEFE